MATQAVENEPLRASDLDELRRRLEEQRKISLAEYEQDVEREREVPLDEPGDLADRAEVGWDRESIFAEVEGDRTLLQETADALRRLEDGAYGVCLDCGEAIPLSRLLAVPWARFCAPHQEETEARAARGAFGAPRRRFPPAAGDDEEGS